MFIQPAAKVFWTRLIAALVILLGATMMWLQPLKAAQAEVNQDRHSLGFAQNVYEVKLGEKINVSLLLKGKDRNEDVTTVAEIFTFNQRIAKSYDHGVIEGINPGTTYLYGNYHNTIYDTAIAEVRVVGEPPEDLELKFDSDEYSMVPEEPVEFRVTAKGKDGVVKDVTGDVMLTSDHFHVVSFYGHDNIYEIFSDIPGEATITALYHGKLAIAKVTSYKQNLKLKLDSEEYSLLAGERLDIQLTATHPNGRTEVIGPGRIQYSFTDNPDVAWVNKITGELIAFGPGEATVTVKYRDFTASAKVYVYPKK
ncbi:hypothetical protein EJP77_01540 [Paenibacillus zeisoli]|uniref:BIG2 domain-containing protein n=1 Tax=Paenibacillus zeisoli TaxID=2496267 RepID=A0A433XP36_9BACL|nr:hypothetical protein [Paenibacillus zeisoli]RUT35728.1 hypothetical protein EJP77_01540 [Paenibacillus zeisoli]